MKTLLQFRTFEITRGFSICLHGFTPDAGIWFAFGAKFWQHRFESSFSMNGKLETGTPVFTLPVPAYGFDLSFLVDSELFSNDYRLQNSASGFFCTVNALVKQGTKRVIHDCISKAQFKRVIPKSYASVSRTVLGWRL